jgi:hypothetical protein
MDKTAKFITASLMVSFLGSGCDYAKIAPKPAVAQTGTQQTISKKDEITVDKIYETKEWKEIVIKWDEMSKVKAANFEEISKVVEREQKSMATLYESLIKGGYLSSVSAEAIKLIYGENLRSTLEKTVQLPCCYEPVAHYEWDCNGVDTREGLNKKLALLEELYKKGTVKKEILDNVKKEISDRLSLLDKADKYWQSAGEGKCEKHPEEVDVILHLYDRNVGGIKEGKDVGLDFIKASKYIVRLEHK